MTPRTAPRRSGSSAASGTRKGIRATEIFLFARVSRAAIVGSDTRNALAISPVDSPHTSLSVSAGCASGASAGWQHMKINRSRSSGITSAGSCSSTAAASSGSTSSGSLEWNTCARRIASIARRFAAVVSQATGLAGTPSPGQTVRAIAYASCTHSSARSRSRATRTVAASTKAQPRRYASATAPLTSSSASCPAIPTRVGGRSHPRRDAPRRHRPAGWPGCARRSAARRPGPARRLRRSPQ